MPNNKQSPPTLSDHDFLSLQSWWDSSEVQCEYCSCTGPGFCFQAPTQWLTIICHPISRVSDILFWYLIWTRQTCGTVHRHAWNQNIHTLKRNVLKFVYLHLFCAHVFMCVEIRGQLAEVDFLLPPSKSLGFNSHHQPRQQALYQMCHNSGPDQTLLSMKSWTCTPLSYVYAFRHLHLKYMLH